MVWNTKQQLQLQLSKVSRTNIITAPIFLFEFHQSQPYPYRVRNMMLLTLLF
jgi:hypothetical protein